MVLMYEGTDMTNYATVSGCICRDCAGKADLLTVELENAADWHRWGPKTDDTIEVLDGTWSSGKMYLQKVTPGDGKYILQASSLPSKAERKSWKSFSEMTLAAITAYCAGECGMTWQLWGVDGTYSYPYLLRKEKGPSGFLEELAEREGAVLKCCGQGMRLIGVEKAGTRNPVYSIIINADQDGVTYKKDETLCWSELTVVSGSVSKSAIDYTVEKGKTMSLSLPAGNDVNAGRWARNLLMMHNRKKETLTMNTGLNLRFGAMEAVDVTGGTEMDGTWLIDSVEHDLIDRKSYIKMTRAVNG